MISIAYSSVLRAPQTSRKLGVIPQLGAMPGLSRDELNLFQDPSQLFSSTSFLHNLNERFKVHSELSNFHITNKRFNAVLFYSAILFERGVNATVTQPQVLPPLQSHCVGHIPDQMHPSTRAYNPTDPPMVPICDAHYNYMAGRNYSSMRLEIKQTHLSIGQSGCYLLPPGHRASLWSLPHNAI